MLAASLATRSASPSSVRRYAFMSSASSAAATPSQIRIRRPQAASTTRVRLVRERGHGGGPRVTTAARSRHPRERRDEGAEASHAGPADERPPADETSYAVQEARGPAAVNSVGPAAWAADLHAFGVALDPGASKVPLAAGTPPPSHPVGCFAASHSRIASAMKSDRKSTRLNS